MVFIRINWTLFTPLLGTVGIYNICKIHILNYLKTNTMKKEYKVEVVKEGALGTIFFGSSKMPLKKMEEVMNKYGEDGWDVEFQLVEKRRLLFFWSREAAIITFSRKKE